jgi:hypothetical protein
MSKIFKSIVGLVIVGAAIGLAAAPAKAESKAAQCKRFEQVGQTFNKQFLGVKRDPNRNYSENINRLVNTSEKALKQFQAQKFSDPKIRGFQQTSLNVFVRFHNGMITTAEAYERNDRPAADRAYKQMMSELEALRPLGKQYDAYCSRSK